MITKQKICSNCGNLQYIWKNVGGKKLCKNCYAFTKVSDSEVKPTNNKTFISPRSPKRILEDIEYKVKRKDYLEKHPMCHIALKIANCTQYAVDIHHLYSGKDKGAHYNDFDNVVGLCRTCHRYITDHPDVEKELNLKK